MEPGNAARPQLAKSAHSPEAAFKELRGKPFVVEVKFDGERVQVKESLLEIKNELRLAVLLMSWCQRATLEILLPNRAATSTFFA